MVSLVLSFCVEPADARKRKINGLWACNETGEAIRVSVM